MCSWLVLLLYMCCFYFLICVCLALLRLGWLSDGSCVDLNLRDLFIEVYFIMLGPPI